MLDSVDNYNVRTLRDAEITRGFAALRLFSPSNELSLEQRRAELSISIGVGLGFHWVFALATGYCFTAATVPLP